MKLPQYVYKKPRIEMIPLIDMIFLVLVFFIYGMLSMGIHRGVPVILPISSTTQMDRKMILTVTVKSDGSLYVDKEPVLNEDLTEKLRAKAMENPDPGVLLFAENTLPYQNLFSVLDRIRMAGLQKISLQAKAEIRP